MLGRRLLPISLSAVLGMVITTVPSRSLSSTQQKYPLELSSKQKHAIEILVSANATPSGFSTPPLEHKFRFKAGEPVHIGIVFKNAAVEPLKICAFSNPFYQNRPELLRDGQHLGYAKRTAELIRQSDLGTCEFTRVPDVVELQPNVPLRVPSIEMQEWYGPLAAGHYEFTLKRTFACCADGLLSSSNEISFDVSPD